MAQTHTASHLHDHAHADAHAHTHVHGLGLPQADGITAAPSATLPQIAHGGDIQYLQVLLYGIGGFLLIVVACVATYIFYGYSVNAMKFERQEMEYRGHESAIAARKSVLDNEFKTFSVADAQASKVRVPIDRAMDKVVATYGKR